MKKKLLITLIAVCTMLFVFGMINTSAATSGTCGDNLTWTLDSEGTLTIRGRGDMTSWRTYSFVPWYSNGKSIKAVVIGESVTSIGSYAFSGCSRLTSITIPDSITSIGDYAFRDCSGLTNIVIPNSVSSIGSQAFYLCDSLTNVYVDSNNQHFSSKDGFLFNKNQTELICCPAGKSDTNYVIPNTVTSIGSCAFRDCSGLTNIVIPNSVSSIGSQAFSGCSRLTSITIPDSVTSIESYVFIGCNSLTSITIPDSVTSIGSYAFSGCSRLTSITIPDSITSIGDYAFRDCSSLTSITIPDGITSIENSAFSGCSSLTSITIPDGITSIENSAFSGCSSLTSVTIPDSITSIGSYAFSGCNSLTSITIPDSITSIGSYAFSSCSNLEEITLPFIGSSRSANGTSDAVFGYIFGGTGTTVKQYYSSSSYASYTIPTSLKEVTITDAEIIPYGAFYNCSGLTSITIPDNVTNIGKNVFYNCSGLTGITIPDGVISIGYGAFGNCNSLEEVHITDLAAWCEIDFDDGSSSNPLYYARNLYLNGEFVTDLEIPDSVTSIGSYAFSGCNSVTSITIPDSVTNIGKYTFYGCSNLEEIILPFIGASRSANETSDAVFGYIFGGTETSVTQYYSASSYANYKIPTSLKKVTITDAEIIPYGAFYDCDSIEEITINADVTSICAKAFYSCGVLNSLTLPMKNVEIANSNVALECENLTIYGLANSDVETFANRYYIDFVVIDYVVEEPVDYRINEITIKDMSGNSLKAIPTGIFLATVSFTNVSSSEDTVIVLAQYTDVGAFTGLMYIQTEDVPTGSTIKLSIPVDNSSGDVAKLKAFCWDSFGSMTPLGNSASFPAE